jgi:hypothetical protein
MRKTNWFSAQNVVLVLSFGLLQALSLAFTFQDALFAKPKV